MKTLFAAALLPLLGTVVACTGTVSPDSPPSSQNAAHGGGSCSFSVAPKKPAPAPAGASMQAQVEAQALGGLYSLIGEYLSGDASVYRGTLSATDNKTAVYGGSVPNGQVSGATSIAALWFAPVSSSDFYTDHPPRAKGESGVFVTHWDDGKAHMIFEQLASDKTTWVTQVDTDEIGVLDSTCSDCAPDFWTRPATMAFDLAATGSQPGFGEPIQITAKASFTKAEPCTIQLSDLELLDTWFGANSPGLALLSGFKLEGGEWVQHYQGTFDVPSGRCQEQTNYTIDLYFDPNDLGQYTGCATS